MWELWDLEEKTTEFCGWSFGQFTGFATYLQDIFITVPLNIS